MVTSDVVIVGGGAVGAALARELARSGRPTVVLEPDRWPGQAWRAAAGMLAPQIGAHQDDPLLPIALAGRELYTKMAEPLREATGIDIGLWQEGIAHVALDEADVLRLKATVAWQRQQGHLCDWLDGAEVRERWPWLGATYGAMWAPLEGALDPTQLVRALRTDAVQLGAQIIDDEAVCLDIQHGRVVGVVGRRDRYPAEHVVLAAGAWTGRIRGLPRPVSVEPVRGQIVALPWPDGVPPAIIYHRNCYLVHRGGEVIAGSTMENAGFDPSVTTDGVARILQTAVALCPQLLDVGVTRSWAGLRPVTPDGLPILGPEPRVEGLWYSTGHGRSGILLAGICGLLLRLLINGQTPTEDLTPFRPDRFWSW